MLALEMLLLGYFRSGTLDDRSGDGRLFLVIRCKLDAEVLLDEDTPSRTRGLAVEQEVSASLRRGSGTTRTGSHGSLSIIKCLVQEHSDSKEDGKRESPSKT